MFSVPQELLGASRVVAKGSVGRGAKAATDAVKDKVEDVQEAWETSQVIVVTCSCLACSAGAWTARPCKFGHPFLCCVRVVYELLSCRAMRVLCCNTAGATNVGGVLTYYCYGE